MSTGPRVTYQGPNDKEPIDISHLVPEFKSIEEMNEEMKRRRQSYGPCCGQVEAKPEDG